MRQPTNNPVFAELLADVERYINKMYVEEKQDEIIYTTSLFDFASTALEAEPPAADYTEFDLDSSMPRVFGTDPNKFPPATPSEPDKLALMSESPSIGSAPYPQEIDHALFSPQKGKQTKRSLRILQNALNSSMNPSRAPFCALSTSER